MIDGKKCKKTFWGDDCYCRFDGNRFIDELGRVLYSFGESDWEIYEEPKPKKTVTIEKWLLKMQGTNQYAIEEGSKEEMGTWGKNKIDAWQKVKLLDTYEVEL